MITADSDILASDFANFIKTQFGGDGSDGALAISSGTTTIDVGGAQFYVLNYTSLSITGTGKLQFINPHNNGTTIIIRVQGNVTLTSSSAPMLDASAMGAIYGAGSNTGTTSGSDGVNGTNGISFCNFQTNFGPKGQSGVSSLGGAVPTSLIVTALSFNVTAFAHKYPYAFVGAGGGGGAAGNVVSGSSVAGHGGRGGGCLILECAGAWNFTTANGISVAGEAGQNAVSQGSVSNGTVTGGGGGGGGYFLGLYRTLTANSGTVNKSGGAGGTNLVQGSGGTLSRGGGGGSATNAGTGSTAASNPTGGVGGDGLSLIAMNSVIN